jgi:hypothetical protein
MYLDAVINSDKVVIYNSIPENVKKFLQGLPEEDYPALDVYDGKSLRRWTVEEYLSR